MRIVLIQFVLFFLAKKQGNRGRRLEAHSHVPHTPSIHLKAFFNTSKVINNLAIVSQQFVPLSRSNSSPFSHSNSSPGQNPGPRGCAATPRATILHRCCPRRIVASVMSRMSGADHRRSATAAALGQIQGTLLVPSTYSLHMHASPPA